MESAHRILGAVLGELSLAIVRRGKGVTREMKQSWVDRLKQVVAIIERSMG